MIAYDNKMHFATSHLSLSAHNWTVAEVVSYNAYKQRHPILFENIGQGDMMALQFPGTPNKAIFSLTSFAPSSDSAMSIQMQVPSQISIIECTFLYTYYSATTQLDVPDEIVFTATSDSQADMLRLITLEPPALLKSLAADIGPVHGSLRCMFNTTGPLSSFNWVFLGTRPRYAIQMDAIKYVRLNVFTVVDYSILATASSLPTTERDALAFSDPAYMHVRISDEYEDHKGLQFAEALFDSLASQQSSCPVGLLVTKVEGNANASISALSGATLVPADYNGGLMISLPDSSVTPTAEWGKVNLAESIEFNGNGLYSLQLLSMCGGGDFMQLEPTYFRVIKQCQISDIVSIGGNFSADPSPSGFADGFADPGTTFTIQCATGYSIGGTLANAVTPPVVTCTTTGWDGLGVLTQAAGACMPAPVCGALANLPASRVLKETYVPNAAESTVFKAICNSATHTTLGGTATEADLTCSYNSGSQTYEWVFEAGTQVCLPACTDLSSTYNIQLLTYSDSSRFVGTVVAGVACMVDSDINPTITVNELACVQNPNSEESSWWGMEDVVLAEILCLKAPCTDIPKSLVNATHSYTYQNIPVSSPYVAGTDWEIICNAGYELPGGFASSAVCQPNGEWGAEGVAEACTPRACEAFFLANSHYAAPAQTYYYGDVYVPQCEAGFYAVAEATSGATCTYNAQTGMFWNAPVLPLCVAGCPALTIGNHWANVTYSLPEHSVSRAGGTTTVTCDTGFAVDVRLPGIEQPSCIGSDDSAGWDDTITTKCAIECEALPFTDPNPVNGVWQVLLGSNVYYPSDAPFYEGAASLLTCNDGYGINGYSEVTSLYTCSDDGVWQGSGSTCLVRECSLNDLDVSMRMESVGPYTFETQNMVAVCADSYYPANPLVTSSAVQCGYTLQGVYKHALLLQDETFSCVPGCPAVTNWDVSWSGVSYSPGTYPVESATLLVTCAYGYYNPSGVATLSVCTNTGSKLEWAPALDAVGTPCLQSCSVDSTMFPPMDPSVGSYTYVDAQNAVLVPIDNAVPVGAKVLMSCQPGFTYEATPLAIDYYYVCTSIGWPITPTACAPTQCPPLQNAPTDLEAPQGENFFVNDTQVFTCPSGTQSSNGGATSYKCVQPAAAPYGEPVWELVDTGLAALECSNECDDLFIASNWASLPTYVNSVNDKRVVGSTASITCATSPTAPYARPVGTGVPTCTRVQAGAPAVEWTVDGATGWETTLCQPACYGLPTELALGAAAGAWTIYGDNDADITAGSAATYPNQATGVLTCASGYYVAGFDPTITTRTTTCVAPSEGIFDWADGAQDCVPIVCPAPPALSDGQHYTNAVAAAGDLLPGDKLEISCAPGFADAVNAPTQIECVLNQNTGSMTWEAVPGDALQCVAVGCAELTTAMSLAWFMVATSKTEIALASYDVGTVATIYCASGFFPAETLYESPVTCSESGGVFSWGYTNSWLINNACESVGCTSEPNVDPGAGDIWAFATSTASVTYVGSSSGYSLGIVATLLCNAGYSDPAVNMTTQCVSDGVGGAKWSAAVVPSCVPDPCPAYDTLIMTGAKFVDDTVALLAQRADGVFTLGDSIELECDSSQGYYPSDESPNTYMYTCLMSNEIIWSSRPGAVLECVQEVATCTINVLGGLANAVITNSQTYVEITELDGVINANDAILVTCSYGYAFYANAAEWNKSYTCGTDGKWPETDVTCKPKSCDAPQPDTNGVTYSYSDQQLGSLATVSCQSNYYGTGTAKSYCVADGNLQNTVSWTLAQGETLPVCEQQCSDIKITALAKVSYSDASRLAGATATLSCTAPYTLVLDSAQSTATCNSPAYEWSRELQSVAGSACAITCATSLFPAGMELRSVEKGIAYSDGSYSHDSVLAFGCTNSAQVFLTSENDVFVSLLHYKCSVGGTDAKLVESYIREPLVPLTCVTPTCATSPKGTVTTPSGVLPVTVNAAVILTCDTGYHATGTSQSSEAKCALDSSTGVTYWTTTSADFACEATVAIKCPEFTVSNGVVSLSNDTILAKTSCNAGYVLSGSEKLTCDTVTGLWSDAMPTCTVQPGCNDVFIENAFASTGKGSWTDNNGIARFVCNPGYEFEQSWSTSYLDVVCDVADWLTKIQRCVAQPTCGTFITSNQSISVTGLSAAGAAVTLSDKNALGTVIVPSCVLTEQTAFPTAATVGSTGQVVTCTHVDLQYAAVWLGSGLQCFTAPALSTATLDASGSRTVVLLRFSAETSRPVHVAGWDPTTADAALCSYLLTTASVALLGTSPQCRWSSVSEFAVTLGTDPSLQPNSTLTVKGGLVGLQVIANSTLYNAAAMPKMAETTTPKLTVVTVTPVVTIKAPVRVSACASAVIDASASTGGGQRAMFFEFTLVSSTADSYDPSFASGFTTATTAKMTFGSTVGGSHVVLITARNWLGFTASVTHTIESTVDGFVMEPTLSGGGALAREVVASAAFSVLASVRVTGCGLESKLEVRHAWVLVNADNSTTALTTQAALSFAPYHFTAGSVTVFKYTTTLVGYPTEQSSLTLTITTTARAPRAEIVVAASSLAPAATITNRVMLETSAGAFTPANAAAAAAAAGTSLRELATLVPLALSLSAATSRDRDLDFATVVAGGIANYTWACYRASLTHAATAQWTASSCPADVAALFSATTANITVSASVVPLLARNDDVEARAALVIALTVATSAGSPARRSRVVARFEIVPAVSFFARPAVILPLGSVPSTSRVSPYAPLRLAANVAGPNNTYALLWACESGNVNVATTGVLASPLTGSTLAIATAALAPDTTYSFRISIFITSSTGPTFPLAAAPAAALAAATAPNRAAGPLPGEAASAVVTVRTAGLPASGSCTQVTDPAELQDALETRALVRCVGWAASTAEELPLRYRWLRADSSLLLASTDIEPSALLALPPGLTRLRVEIVSALGVPVLVAVNVTTTIAASPAVRTAAVNDATAAVAAGDAWTFVQSASTATQMLSTAGNSTGGTGNSTDDGSSGPTLSPPQIAQEILALLKDPSVQSLLADAEGVDSSLFTENSSNESEDGSSGTADDETNVIVPVSALQSAGSALAIELLATLAQSPAAELSSQNISLTMTLVEDNMRGLVEASRAVSPTTLTSYISVLDANVNLLAASNSDSSSSSSNNSSSSNSTDDGGANGSTSVAGLVGQQTALVTQAALQDAQPNEDPLLWTSGAVSFVTARLDTETGGEISLQVDGSDDSSSVAGALPVASAVLLTSASARFSHHVARALGAAPRAFSPAAVKKGVRVPGALLKTLGTSTGGRLDATVSALSDATLLAADALEAPDARADVDDADTTYTGSFAGSIGLTLFDSTGAEVSVASTGVDVAVSNGTAPAPVASDEEENGLFFVTIPHEKRLPVNFTATCQFLDVSTNKWSQRGCAVAESTTEYTLCKCNHLTMFSIRFSPKYFAPKFITFDVTSFTSLSWSQITRNPVPLIVLCVWVGVMLVLLFVGARIDRKYDKQGLAKLLVEWHPASQISLTKADEYRVAARSSTLLFLWRRYFQVFRRDHSWLSLWLRPTTDDFGSQARAVTTGITILMALTIAATFFGSQEQEAALVISAITTAVTYPINKLFQAVFEYSDKNRLKRFLYFYAEHLAFLQIHGRSDFFSPAQCARLLATPPLADLEIVRELLPEVAKWHESDDEAAERFHKALVHARKQELAGADADGSGNFTTAQMSQAQADALRPEPLLRVPNTYTTHRGLDRDESTLHLILRTSVAMDAELVIEAHRHRDWTLKVPRGARAVGVTMISLITVGCIMLVLVMGMEMDRSNGSDVVTQWIYSTLGSIAVDAVLSGPILTMVRSTIVFMVKYMFLGKCCSIRARRYDCMPKLLPSRRLSFSANTSMTSFLEIMGAKCEPGLVYDTPAGLDVPVDHNDDARDGDDDCDSTEPSGGATRNKRGSGSLRVARPAQTVRSSISVSGTDESSHSEGRLERADYGVFVHGGAMQLAQLDLYSKGKPDGGGRSGDSVGTDEPAVALQATPRWATAHTLAASTIVAVLTDDRSDPSSELETGSLPVRRTASGHSDDGFGEDSMSQIDRVAAPAPAVTALVASVSMPAGSGLATHTANDDGHASAEVSRVRYAADVEDEHSDKHGDAAKLGTRGHGKHAHEREHSVSSVRNHIRYGTGAEGSESDGGDGYTDSEDQDYGRDDGQPEVSVSHLRVFFH